LPARLSLGFCPSQSLIAATPIFTFSDWASPGSPANDAPAHVSQGARLKTVGISLVIVTIVVFFVVVGILFTVVRRRGASRFVTNEAEPDADEMALDVDTSFSDFECFMSAENALSHNRPWSIRKQMNETDLDESALIAQIKGPEYSEFSESEWME
jgi:hypothetical protein